MALASRQICAPLVHAQKTQHIWLDIHGVIHYLANSHSPQSELSVLFCKKKSHISQQLSSGQEPVQASCIAQSALPNYQWSHNVDVTPHFM